MKQAKRTKMRAAALLAAALGVMVGMLGKAQAASTDSIQLVVTPSVIYSVQLTSASNYAGVPYNFGTVDLNVTTRTETRVLVQNNGNVTSRWQVSALQDGATWSLGTSTGSDTAVLKALFNSAGGAVPDVSSFTTTNGSTITASGRIAANNTLSTSNVVDTVAVNAQRDLFFMLHTPNTSGSAAAQTFRVYVTAVP